MKRLFTFIIIICLSAVSIAQNDKIDSLLNALEDQAKDKQAETLNNLANSFIRMDTEKSEQYAKQALDLAKEYNNVIEEANAYYHLGRIEKYKGDYDQSLIYHKDALRLRELNNQKEDIARSLNNIGTIYFDIGEYEVCIEYYEKSLPLKREVGDEKGEAITLYNMGNVYTGWGNYEKSIDCFQKAQNIFEKINFAPGLAACLNSNGLVYEKWEYYDKALEFYTEALEMNKEMDDKVEIGNQYNNIGNIYSQKKDLQEALKYYKLGLEVRQEINHLVGISSSLQNIGITYTDLNKTKEAMPYYEKSLEICKETENVFQMINILTAIGRNYTAMSECEKAIKYLNEGREIAVEANQNDLVMANLRFLHNAYLCKNDAHTALEVYKTYIGLRDSLYNAENFKQLSELQTKYETEKKEQALKNQEEINIKQGEVNKKQTIILYGAGVAFLIILFFSFMLFRQFSAKKKAYTVLETKNQEILQKNQEIEAQRDEISAQRDMVEKQRDQISIIHEELTDSIHYAERIQRAILPDEEYAASILNDCFILFKPKDVVSGDFYWSTRIGGLSIITAADCTGHGVPGAFMSMLGVAFLNEIVRKEEVTTASHVLDHLRQNVIASLKQKGVSGEQKDGMDMALCVIQNEKRILQYAGANNPLWLIRNSILPEIDKMEKPEDAIEETKADKMPVAIYEKMDPYTNQVFQLEEGDTVYMFSDGYADQFGGPKGKKLKYRPFKRLIVKNASLSMNEQKVELDKTIEEWMAYTDPITNEPFEQVDDIVIVGVRM